MHDTIGCYLDIDKGQVKFSKNGKLSMGCFVWEYIWFSVFVIFKIPSLSSVLSPFLLSFLLDKCLLNIFHVSGMLVGSRDAAEKGVDIYVQFFGLYLLVRGGRQIYDMLEGNSGYWKGM